MNFSFSLLARCRRVLPACLLPALLGLAPTAVQAYTLEGPRWPSNNPVVMYVQLGSPSKTLTDGSTSWNDVAESALAIWNPCLGSGVQFSVGTTTIPNVQGDHKNSVFFSSSAFGSSFGEDALAVTIYTSNTAGTQFTEADVVVNNAYSFDSYRGPLQGSSAYDLRRVLLHEFGHVLGMDHPPDGTVAIMEPVISDIDNLQADDIAGVESIYGAIAGNPPVITSSLSTAGTFGKPFQYQIRASNSPISYYVVGLPGSVSFNTTSGVISATPLGSTGTYNIGLKAMNASGTGTATLVLTILGPPVITSPNSVTAQTGQPFTYQIRATGSPTSYTATGSGGTALPAGITVNTASGLVSGTMPAGGSYLVVEATNAAGTGSAQVTLNGTPGPPVITGVSNGNVFLTANQAYTGTPCLFIVSANPYPNSYAATGLPPGLTIDSDGWIQGTPTTAGVYPVTLSATSAVGTGTYVWTLQVGQTIALTSGTVTGQVGVPLTYQITGSPMPTNFQFLYSDDHAGLSLDAATGVISGAPMTASTGAIRVTMSDGADGAIVDIPVNFAPNVVSSFFNGEDARDPAYLLVFPNGNYFGYYAYLSDRHYIYHFDLGYEYVFDAADGKSGAYFYDFKSGGFFYSSPTFPFPYLYDFALNSVVYYYPSPDQTWRYNTDGYRFFYVFNTKQIISK